MQRVLSMVVLLGLLVFIVPFGLLNAQQPGATAGQREFTFQQYLNRHDANKDGQVSLDEFKGDPTLFKRRDQNGDGLVTEAEFEAGNKRRGQPHRGRPVPDGTKAIRDLVYAQVDGESLKLDLYLPQVSETKPPLVVWIHGGGWTRGSKAQINPAFIRLTADGYRLVPAEYTQGKDREYARWRPRLICFAPTWTYQLRVYFRKNGRGCLMANPPIPVPLNTQMAD